MLSSGTAASGRLLRRPARRRAGVTSSHVERGLYDLLDAKLRALGQKSVDLAGWRCVVSR